jgi:uncharacterized protein
MAKYHMNKKEKEITDKNEILRILKNQKFAVIAMCAENEPYIVSLSYGYSETDNCLYFHSALKGLKIDFINKNENVCATVIEDKGYQNNNCEHHYSSVVMWGKMSVISDLDEKKHAMNTLLTHLEENPEPIMARNFKNDEMYNKFALLKLEITDITGKSGS